MGQAIWREVPDSVPVRAGMPQAGSSSSHDHFFVAQGRSGPCAPRIVKAHFLEMTAHRVGFRTSASGTCK